ncbi:ribosome hibernation-promoting factor, HPF/YfiA family [Peptoniphilus indolicus]|uniref:Ribosome hibernation promoting factor n=2 Tax=Peptoniphilus indolicus TaxID=33030 RepID=G4D0S2_9FIRM|nr:ribosome-associated translation inhibitor RaiA [Peptoniphilus indolicus]EGY80868.1 ribosomal subunit interface protein [Peptoniphilus indolicus ATCC 29427]SUB74698.1 Ribosome-associated factor Y [Peptoniphilus indolicus]
MKLKLIGKNLDLTQSLKEQSEKKLEKLDRYFDEEVEVRAVLSVEKDNRTVEVTVFLPGTILRAEDTSDDMYASIDATIDILERQIRKYKTRLKNRYQDPKTIRFENIESLSEEETEESKIVKRKTFTLKPMMEEEAEMQMDLLNHNFFIYLNAETEEIDLLYRRNDGNLGLIEVEVER